MKKMRIAGGHYGRMYYPFLFSQVKAGDPAIGLVKLAHLNY